MRMIIATAILAVLVPFRCFGGGPHVSENASIELHIISADISPSAINIDYKLVNRGTEAVFVVDAAPNASIDNWPKVPFVRFEKSDGMLEISSYIASLPKDRLIESPYYHPVVRLSPGESIRHISLRAPVSINLPYSMVKPELLELDDIKAVHLQLAYIPCDQVERVKQRLIEKPSFEYVSGLSVIECDNRRASLFEFQSYVDDEIIIPKKDSVD